MGERGRCVRFQPLWDGSGRNYFLFAARKLPDLARSMGRSIGEFKKGRDEGEKAPDKDEDRKLPKE